MITTADIESRKLAIVALVENTGVLTRFLSRQQGMWTPYARTVPTPHTDWNTKIMDLRSAGYGYFLNRLEQLSWLELQGVLYQFDKAMASIDAEAQRWVIEEAAKRFSHDLDMALMDAKIVTKEAQLDEKTQTVTEKIAALEADQYALETEQARLQMTKERNEMRIKELEAQLDLMDVEIAQAEADVLREELKRLRAEMDVVQTEIRAVELQTAISRVALEVEQESVRRAEIETDIVATEVRKEKESLVELDLDIEAERLANMQEDTANRATVRTSERAHRDGRYYVLDAYLRTLQSLYAQESQAREDEMRARLELQLDAEQQQRAKMSAQRDLSSTEKNSKISDGKDEVDMRIRIDEADDDLIDARIKAVQTAADAALDAARTLAKADIETALTHTIKGA